MNMMNANLEENAETNKELGFESTNKAIEDEVYIEEINTKPKPQVKEENLSENIFIKVIEVSFNQFSNGLKIIGPFFAFALITFILVVTHTFFTVLLPYWNNILGLIFSILISFLCLFILFNILFNYLLAVLVRPGSLEDIKKSKLYKDKNPYLFDNQTTEEINIHHLLQNNNIEITSTMRDETTCLEINTDENNKETKSKLKFCRTCNELKPLRAHHCQICGYCVFKMDHHCPWINNCVGQNNHRYFVLFLTHTLIGCIFIAALSAPLFFSNNVRNLPTQFNFVCILCIAGTFLLLFFNVWNWFLVLNGNTTIEFWSSRMGVSSNGLISDFSFNSIYENIYLVFGTKSILKAVFVPSVKMLPYSGLEWSRYCDSNYKVKELEGEGRYYHDEITQSIENDLLKDIQI